MLEALPEPVVAEYGGVRIVRDDLLPGGTKVRALAPLMAKVWPEEEFVFGGPAQGYAQLALAHSAARCGKRATFFCAERATLHPLTKQAQAAGAEFHFVPAGRLSAVQKRARDYAEEAGARFLPLGFDVPEFSAAMLEAARAVERIQPEQVWCVAGTGCLSRCLQELWPNAEHHAVQIGFEPKVGRATHHKAPESFAQPARHPPPFPSCVNYDAKAWAFICEGARPGALFWNVGA